MALAPASALATAPRPVAARAVAAKWSANGRRGMLCTAPMPSQAEIVQRTLPVAILSIALISVPVVILRADGLPRLRSLQKELSAVNADNDELRRQIARLRVQVAHLRDDPAAVERIARDELGMVRKTEVVFQFGR